MDFIKEDYVLGNKKIIVGDAYHDLVLENLGKIYVKYGNSYKDFQSFISTVSSSSSNASRVIIEPNGLKSASEYKTGALVYDSRKQTLYLKYQNSLLLLLEYNDGVNEKYVNKRGDKMTGPLEIDYDGVPLKITSAHLIENLNSEYLLGKTPEHFAQKALNEIIPGNWTFLGYNTHNGVNKFNNKVIINGELEENSTSKFAGKAEFENEIEVGGTGTFKNSGTAIRVGTGDIITDGSIGSSQFMSGMTGYGWRLDADTNTLTIDNLIVRGVLNVFELVVNKITATNGSLWITDSFKIDKLHNIIYLDLDKLDSIQLTEESLKGVFNLEDYYIPVCLDFIRTETPSTSTHPYATRDEENPEGEDTPSFDFLNWIFKIVDLNKFINKFAGETYIQQEENAYSISVSNLIDLLKEKYGYDIYSDSSDVWRISNVEFDPNNRIYFYDASNLPIKIDKSEHDEHRDAFLIIDNNLLSLYDSRESGIIYVNDPNEVKFKEIVNVEHQINPTLTLNNLLSEVTLKSLVSEKIIEINHVFQKDPESVLELEEIPNTEIAIYPDGVDEFTSLLFTIINSKRATLTDGHYIYDPEAVCRINLYYKYFGSNINDGLNLYIVESDHNEYPVFKPGDILKCQKFTGNSVEQYHALVLGLVDNYSFIIQLQNYSLLQEGIKYSYNENNELLETSAEIGSTLYQRSEGLRINLDFYLNDAKEALRSLANGENIPDALIDWCLQILLPQEEVDTEKQNILNALNNPTALSSVIENIISNSINGLSEEEILNHPIFKKIVEFSSKGKPIKEDSLVRIGSILFGDRRNSMYLTSSESNSPYTDVLVGVNRPDYTVVYLTPKYVKFEASLNFEDGYRKGCYYLQEDTFGEIISRGNNNGVLSSEELAIYNKYAQFAIEVQRPQEEGLTTDVRNVSLTLLPNNDTAYKNGNPLTQEVDGDILYVSTNINDTIIDDSFSPELVGSDTYDIDDEHTITLFIGENG